MARLPARVKPCRRVDPLERGHGSRIASAVRPDSARADAVRSSCDPERGRGAGAPCGLRVPELLGRLLGSEDDLARGA